MKSRSSPSFLMLSTTSYSNLIDNFDSIKYEIDSSLKYYKIPGRTQMNGSKPIEMLQDLSMYEEKFHAAIQALKNDYRILKKRARSAKKIIKTQIYDGSDESTLNEIIKTTEKAEKIITGNSLQLLADSIVKESNETIKIEGENLTKRHALESRKLKIMKDMEELNKSKRSEEENGNEMDSIFQERGSGISLNDTEKRINQLCKSVKKRNDDIKNEKKAIKQLEKDNLAKREKMNEILAQQEARIQELKDSIVQGKKHMKDHSDQIVANNQMKNDLKKLEDERAVLERQNYTVTRDKLYNSKYKKQVDEMRNALKNKQDLIELNKVHIEEKRKSLKEFGETVKEMEQKLVEKENEVSMVEKMVNESDNQFKTTIDESKKQIDALAVISETKTKSFNPRSGVNDEISALLNENASVSQAPVTLPFSPRRKYVANKDFTQNVSPTKTCLSPSSIASPTRFNNISPIGSPRHYTAQRSPRLRANKEFAFHSLAQTAPTQSAPSTPKHGAKSVAANYSPQGRSYINSNF